MDEFEKLRLKEKEDAEDIAKEILDHIDLEIEKSGINANQVLIVLETIMEDLNQNYNVLDSEIDGHYEDPGHLI